MVDITIPIYTYNMEVWNKKGDIVLRNTKTDCKALQFIIDNKVEKTLYSLAEIALHYLERVEKAEKEIANYMAFGEGGATFKESRLLDKLYKAEARIAELEKEEDGFYCPNCGRWWPDEFNACECGAEVIPFVIEGESK